MRYEVATEGRGGVSRLDAQLDQPHTEGCPGPGWLNLFGNQRVVSLVCANLHCGATWFVLADSLGEYVEQSRCQCGRVREGEWCQCVHSRL